MKRMFEKKVRRHTVYGIVLLPTTFMCVAYIPSYGTSNIKVRDNPVSFSRTHTHTHTHRQELSGLQAGNLKHSVTIDSAFVNMISYANFHSNQ